MLIAELRRAFLDEIRKRGIQVKRMPPVLIQRPDEVILELTLAHLAARHLLDPDPDFFFVQIGAFDGQDALHDLIMHYNWSGVLVEPQSGAFEALRAMYGNSPGLALRQVAIGERDEIRPFYGIASGPGIPEWTAQLGSFDPAVPLSWEGLGDNGREHLISEKVRCMTFESLLSDVDHVDLLQIDVEGYDARLIQLFDFDRWEPSIVQFEHRHLSLADHDAAIRRLVGHGYRVAVGRFDTAAYRDRRRD